MGIDHSSDDFAQDAVAQITGRDCAVWGVWNRSSVCAYSPNKRLDLEGELNLMQGGADHDTVNERATAEQDTQVIGILAINRAIIAEVATMHWHHDSRACRVSFDCMIAATARQGRMPIVISNCTFANPAGFVMIER